MCLEVQDNGESRKRELFIHNSGLCCPALVSEEIKWLVQGRSSVIWLREVIGNLGKGGPLHELGWKQVGEGYWS